ncbi:helix-turn-helix domain-containing protein [Aliarcobacter thereius]|uniref:Helix-turn-helix domain-containing protein n=1 Tax=Aliarcobacter thereius TaxID=544718 RepID=A0A5R9H4N6_9BACT|nr:helix-turn-helix domain-containing protein [Aliarcobacter thereius]TLS71048.1 helix-turn-helix domain-containing protein [Aliarcobacter thereius]TLT06652.1 helix-turn-helix domain-containing protein [Aliarcobacter thereius]
MPIQEEISYFINEINQLGFKEKINLSVVEASKILGISRSHLYALRSRKTSIDYIEVGNKILYPKKSLAEFLAKEKIKTKKKE